MFWICFGFVTEKVLIIYRCFGYLWTVLTQCQDLLFFTYYTTGSRLGMHKKLGRNTAGTADPDWPKGYSTPYDITLCNKNWGKEGGRWGCLQLWSLSSQVTVKYGGALLSWTWLNTCLLLGNRNWFPYFALLVHTAFILPVKMSLSQSMSFLMSTLLILFRIPLRGEWANGCVGLTTTTGYVNVGISPNPDVVRSMTNPVAFVTHSAICLGYVSPACMEVVVCWQFVAGSGPMHLHICKMMWCCIPPLVCLLCFCRNLSCIIKGKLSCATWHKSVQLLTQTAKRSKLWCLLPCTRSSSHKRRILSYQSCWVDLHPLLSFPALMKTRNDSMGLCPPALMQRKPAYYLDKLVLHTQGLCKPPLC